MKKSQSKVAILDAAGLLKHFAQQHAEAFDLVALPIFIVNPEAQIIHCNNEGQDLQTLLQSNLDSNPKFRGHIQQVTELTKERDSQHLMLESFEFQATIEPILFQEKSGLGAVITLKRDINTLSSDAEFIRTNEKRIRELAASNRSKNRIIDSMMNKSPFGIMLFDSHQQLLRMNAAARQILDCDRDDITGAHCSDFFDCHERNDGCPMMQANSSIDREEVKIPGPDESDNWILRSANLIEENGDQLILETFVDISEIKQTQELERLVETEKAKNRAQSAFIANMSHELRTPLNAIVGFSEILLEETQEDEQLEKFFQSIRSINESGKHLTSLVEQLLDLSKARAGKIRLFPELVSVESILRNCIEIAEPIALKNNNTLKINCAEELGLISIDVMRFKQVILNLLGNACKFTTYGTIQIEAIRNSQTSPKHLEIYIKDTGIGMTKEELSRVFNPFEQADSSTTRVYGGSGLGLYISRMIVHLMEGEISVDSTPGKGSSFCVSLPIKIDDMEDQDFII